MRGQRRTRRGGGAPVAAINDEHVRATPETPRVRGLTPDETRAWADIATDDEHYCEHVKHFRRARVEAAYRASVNLLTTAWKENPEFGIAIDMATYWDERSR